MSHLTKFPQMTYSSLIMPEATGLVSLADTIPTALPLPNHLAVISRCSFCHAGRRKIRIIQSVNLSCIILHGCDIIFNSKAPSVRQRLSCSTGKMMCALPAGGLVAHAPPSFSVFVCAQLRVQTSRGVNSVGLWMNLSRQTQDRPWCT